jgi:hypothetical protein
MIIQDQGQLSGMHFQGQLEVAFEWSLKRVNGGIFNFSKSFQRSMPQLSTDFLTTTLRKMSKPPQGIGIPTSIISIPFQRIPVLD